MEENTQPAEGMEQEAPVVCTRIDSSFTFVSEEEVCHHNNLKSQQPIEQAAPEVQQKLLKKPMVAQPEAQPEYQPEQIDTAVFEFLSERLGRDINSLDDLQVQQQEQRELDERIEAIANFVQKDWPRSPRLVYLSAVNPSKWMI